MLKRTAMNTLIRWKKREHHPLVISGLRQVGKTFTVREFGHEYYKNVVYLDLRENNTIHSVFEGDFIVDQMVLAITANQPDAVFEAGNTLLILDEIQDCPNARSSLKYWDLDKRYDVIATGSFLGVKGFRKPYTRGIPVGFEETMVMHPLSFREFIRNIGLKDQVLEYVEQSLEKSEIIQTTIHESMRSLYLQYLIVGGMPEAVNKFLETHDINQVRRIQVNILNSIRDDFGRYKDSNSEDKVNEVLKLRAEACLDSLPIQLAKEYKKFQYSLVDVKGHSPEKADGLEYLVDVGLVVKSFNIREISCPLEGVKIKNEFKVFMTDTGLLMSQLELGTAAQVLQGNLSAYKGAIAENMVAASFAAEDSNLYYYHAPNGSPELDFIYNKNGVPTIVECKSTNGRATSMKYVLADPKKYGVHPAVKIADTNVGVGPGYKTYPIYALGFLPSGQDAFIVN